jgi:hypothetical protein
MLPVGLTRLGLKAMTFVVAHSPEILMGIGTIASVGAAVTGFTDSPRALEDLKTGVSELKEIKRRFTDDAFKASREEINYGKKEYYIDVCRHTLGIAKRFCRNYWKTMLLEAVALTSFLGAYHIISQRLSAAVAFGASVKKAFDAYRDRVREKYGDEAEKDIYLGRGDKIKKGSKDSEGNDISGAKEAGTPVSDSVCHMTIGPGHPAYFESIPRMMYQLRNVWAYWNKQLKSGHVVTMNDIARNLCDEETAERQIAGWTPDGGDGFIDFGVDLRADYTDYSNYGLEYVKCEDGKYRPVYELYFNIDGIVLNGFNKYKHAH